MELKDIIAAVKTDFPKKAIDLSESLELLNETISDTMNPINVKINEAFLNRDFNTREKFDQMVIAIYKYEQLIAEIVNQLEVELLDIQPEDNVIEKEKKDTPNYAEYYVDTNNVHTLYEDFTHKRPCGFRINEERVVEVTTWKEMLVNTCEFLLVVDENKFMSFEHMSRMNGKKRKYFSIDKEDMFEPWIVGGKIFVETHMSSNGFRNLIVKLLKEYNFKINEFKVYLRAGLC
jgi:hypothetical protein